MTSSKLIYLMDPQCGWCFGYSETMQQIAAHYQSDKNIGLSVVTGGLFSPALAIDVEFAQSKKPIAERISERFDVQFSEAYFAEVLGSGNLDSLPPCLVINAVAAQEPDAALGFSKLLIDAAFKQARNISKLEVCLEVASECGYDPKEIETLVVSTEIKQQTQRSFDFAQKTGVGFPSLFIQKNQDIHHLGGAELNLDQVKYKVAAILA